ncbi:uncharacterized protein ACO6RY_19629 [Pungitius sinensis]
MQANRTCPVVQVPAS